MKKFRIPFVLLFLIVILINSAPVLGESRISGNSAVLIDAISGQLLYEQNKDEKLPPASTTKMLTAIIAIESGKLDEIVTIGANPPKLEGTSVYLEEGEKIKLRDLVQAALIFSANDAALAIAEYLSGTAPEFAKLMNSKAKEIGALNSNFVNPHGLTEEGHYSTAYDLALVGKYAMNNTGFQEIVRMKVLDWQGQAWQTRLINKNEILWTYSGANGIKTGYTKDSKNTIVASASREGRNYIAAVLGSSGNGIWEDAKTLLNIGFSEFQQIELAESGEIKALVAVDEDKELQLVPKENFLLSLPTGVDKNKLQSKIVLEQNKEEIREGDVAGHIIYYLEGQEVGKLELVAANTITPEFDYIKLISLILSGIFCLQICWRVYRLKRRRQRRSYNFGNCYKEY